MSSNFLWLHGLGHVRKSAFCEFCIRKIADINYFFPYWIADTNYFFPYWTKLDRAVVLSWSIDMIILISVKFLDYTGPLNGSIFIIFFISISIYPITARFVWAPQMMSQPVSSIFPCSLLPSRTWRTPGLSIPWGCLPISFSVCLVFFPISLCLARLFWWTGDMSIPLQFASLYDDQELFVSTDCLLDLGTDFFVGNMVFAWDAWYLAVAPHFHGLYSSLELCCEGPWFTSKQEDGCDKGEHQTYLGTQGNITVFPNWFQPCQCCCCLCCSGEDPGLGTLISYNWALVLDPRTPTQTKNVQRKLSYFTLYLLADALPNYPSVEPVLSDKQKIDSKGKRNLELLTLLQNYFAYRFLDFFSFWMHSTQLTYVVFRNRV